MTWRSCSCSLFLLFLCVAGAPAAGAADDSAAAVVADCGSADLPDSQLDSCLERVRVLDETDPSAQLQSLEAQLEQRETGHRTASHQPRPLNDAPEAASSDPGSYATQPTIVETERTLPPEAAEPDQDRSAAGEETPASAAPDERSSDDEGQSIDTGADRPPPGINDDQPPVADPPDSDTQRDQDDDPPGDSSP